MIAAQSILRMLDQWRAEDVNMHGFILSQWGEVVASGAYAPFALDVPHRMYSISKSFTSLAVGMLMEDGALRLDDRVSDFFPEYAPVPEATRRATVRDLLTMRSPHSVTAYKRMALSCYAEAFFRYPPSHRPGTIFTYDTSATQALGALVERVSGMPLDVFLERRLFEPLGLPGAQRWLRDPSGACLAGTGLILSLSALHQVSALLLRGGDGLISPEYLREATACQVDTCLQAAREERQGYGFLFWRVRQNGYAMYGKAGQLAVVIPKSGLILCTTADTEFVPLGVQAIYDGFFDCVANAQADADTPGAREALSARLDHLRVMPLNSPPDAVFSAYGEYVFPDENPLGLRALTLTPDSLTLRRDGADARMSFGLNRMVHGTFPNSAEPCMASARICDDRTLHIRCHIIGDTPAGVDILIAAHEHAITVRMRGADEPVFLRGYTGDASGMLKSDAISIS